MILTIKRNNSCLTFTCHQIFKSGKDIYTNYKFYEFWWEKNIIFRHCHLYYSLLEKTVGNLKIDVILQRVVSSIIISRYLQWECSKYILFWYRNWVWVSIVIIHLFWRCIDVKLFFQFWISNIFYNTRIYIISTWFWEKHNSKIGYYFCFCTICNLVLAL